MRLFKPLMSWPFCSLLFWNKYGIFVELFVQIKYSHKQKVLALRKTDAASGSSRKLIAARFSLTISRRGLVLARNCPDSRYHLMVLLTPNRARKG